MFLNLIDDFKEIYGNSNYLITIDFNDNKRKYEKIDGQIKIVNKNYINNGEKIKTKEKFHDIL